MSRYRFELAGPDDDADLRRVLAQTPMPGAVAVTFRREPSYFAAAVVDGRFRQVIAARDAETGRIIGFGVRSVAERYVNGETRAVGYLSALRLLAEHRNLGLVTRGYAFFRRLHQDGRTPLYLTTIAEDNAVALSVLTSGRAGLPGYHFAGRYHTVALAPAKHKRRRNGTRLTVRPAKPSDVPTALAFWHSVGPRRQFFPCYREEDFFSPNGMFRDLRPDDLLLAFRGDRLVGTLAGWDQTGFKQTVVAGYGRALRWGRPLYNAWAWLLGLPRLPAPGAALRSLTAALPLAEDPESFSALLDALLHRAGDGRWDYLLVGLHEADPLWPTLAAYPARRYTTRLYLVCWDDGDEVRESLDGRPPYLELGCL